MAVKESKNNAATNQGELETWIPAVIPALKTCWAEHGTGLLAGRPLPKMSDWLALLHTAAVNPQKIPHHLAQLFNEPQRSADRQRSWIILTKLFAVTFEAVQQSASHLDAGAWPGLLEIQNRILRSAATVSLVGEDRPATDVLSRRALYLQIITDVNKKLVVLQDPNEVLAEVVALIQQNLGYDYVSLFSLDQAKQTLTLQSAAWKDQQPPVEALNRLPVAEQGLTSRAVTTGQAVLANDMAKDLQLSPPAFLPNIKAQLSLPLLAGSNLWGVLDIASEQVNVFTPDDCQILPALAGYMAAIMENARGQKLLQRHMREHKLLYESNIALDPSLDTQAVLKLMTQKTAEALAAGACTICKIDNEANTITNQAEYVLPQAGHPAHTWRRLDTPTPLAEDPIARQVLKTGRVVVEWADAQKPAPWPQPAASTGAEASWGTVLALPLAVNKRITGLIEIYDKNPHRNFSVDDVQLGQILATQTTLAIERAQLFEETHQRLSEVSTLYTMAQDIAGNLDLQTVLDSIVTSLRRVTGCRGCCIFLLDQDEQKLEIKAADGLKPQWREMAKLNIGEGAAGMAVAQKQTIYIPDTRKQPDFIFFDEDVRSLMVIPLMAQGKIIGAINLDDSKPNAFGPAQEQLLTIAAAQAGIAIENARLFAKAAADQQQTQAIIQYMADGLLLIDDQGVIVTCNPALSMMLGLHPGEIVGQKVDAPDLHPKLASITGTTTQRARTGVLAKEVNIETPRPRTLQIFSTTVVGDDKKPIGEVRVVHDVTRERELEQLKEDFMSTISHELRTPLFSIQGFVQILLENEGDLDATTRQEFLTIIQTQAVQLSEMVNNLLDASKFDEGKLKFDKQPVAVLDLIQQTMLKLRGFAHQQKVSVTPKLPATLPVIIGDKERLEQVLTNLIGNAIKFTPEGGQVTVSAAAPNNELLVEVKDTGLGILPEAQEHIFSRYYQVEDKKSESSKKGSGLGLYIAQQIIKGHGGEIWVESKGIPGQGSIFRFTLPLPETPIEV
ncbi:MAG: GAF domain-containing protein [Anaerolineae bacterium]|nr:GAF domain-containing protein [Anaerolineae bacterium]